MRKQKFSIDKIDIIEYYDGLVRGIAETQTGSYLVVLLKWEMDRSQKLFGFLKISGSQVTRIRQCFDPASGGETIDARWADFEETYNDIVRSFNQEIYLLPVEPEVHHEYTLEVSDYDPSLLTLESYDMEKIMS